MGQRQRTSARNTQENSGLRDDTESQMLYPMRSEESQGRREGILCAPLICPRVIRVKALPSGGTVYKIFPAPRDSSICNGPRLP